MNIDLNKINYHIKQKLILETSHPEKSNIKIYNYTHSCQYGRMWDDITRRCRGLIVDTDTSEIIANPFPKFFNYGEEEIDLPNEIPVVTKKYDGSLGILYWIDSKPYIATRGSFTSDQAKWATEWLRNNVKRDVLDRSKTYLFEIIYSENRIVVKYDFEGLVLIAIRDTKIGKEHDLEKIELKDNSYMAIAEEYSISDIKELAAINRDNEEGFVIFYRTSGLRLKIKFKKYLEIHKIINGVNRKVVWEYLKEDKDIESLLENVPDEFYKSIKATEKELIDSYKEIEDICREELKNIPSGDRRIKAEYVKTTKHPAVLFSMLDNKDYKKAIFMLIKSETCTIA
ncbi:hypothetical protein KAR91_18300 [Candidatus Pacearchaeota archaeon]|nr:hypothetical protein [Candidatus Pacearchaeota archaeon]